MKKERKKCLRQNGVIINDNLNEFTPKRSTRMDQTTLSILDYYTLLHYLSENCGLEYSKQKALNLVPANCSSEVEYQLHLTGEWIKINEKYDFSFSGICNFQEIYQKAIKQGQGFSLDDIYKIGQMIQQSDQIIDCSKNWEKQYPLSADIINQMPNLKLIEKKIFNVIDENRQIKDQATPHLKKIRRQIAHHRQYLLKHAQNLTEKYNQFIQEDFTTQRNNRFVIAVKTENQNKIKGIVHDVSETGATVFMEPLELLSDNNTMQKLIKDEQWEINKIVTELTTMIQQHSPDLENIFENLIHLDIIRAKAKLSKQIQGELPSPGPLDLHQARHPLLLLMKGFENTVPLDIKFPPGNQGILISGPNAGGKTIALKTVGLLILAAYSGIHIPIGLSSTLPYDFTVICEGGDQQSIELDVSTFTGRVKRWNKILKSASTGCLVLIDEIGSATDPDKGSALAAALIDKLIEQGALLIATTNNIKLKKEIESAEKAINASMDMDQNLFQPTFHLTMGLPGSSYTFEIAEKFGMDKSIINRARSRISQDDQSYEHLVDQTKLTLGHLQQQQQKLEEQLQQQQNINEEYQQKLSRLNQQQTEFEQSIKIQKKEILTQARKEVEKIIKEIRESQAHPDIIKKAKKILHPPPPPKSAKHSSKTFSPGDQVWVINLNTSGKVLQKKEFQYQVQAGPIKILCPPENLTPHSPNSPQSKTKGIIFTQPREITSTLDLRGKDSATAAEQLIKFLDDAQLAQYPMVTIIHGIGTGVLKQTVTEFLKYRNYRFSTADPSQGGAGATLVFLD